MKENRPNRSCILLHNKSRFLLLAVVFALSFSACGHSKQPVEVNPLSGTYEVQYVEPDLQPDSHEEETDMGAVQPSEQEWEISTRFYRLMKRKGMEDGWSNVVMDNPFIDHTDTTLPPSKRVVSFDGQERELTYEMSDEGEAVHFYVGSTELRLIDFYKDEEWYYAGYLHNTDELRYLKYPEATAERASSEILDEESCMAKAVDAVKDIIRVTDYKKDCIKCISEGEVPTHYIFGFWKELGGIGTSDYVSVCISVYGEVQELWIGDIGRFDNCTLPIPSEEIINDAIKGRLQDELDKNQEIRDYGSSLLIIQADEEKVLIQAEVYGMTNGNFPKYANATMGVECKKTGE